MTSDGFLPYRTPFLLQFAEPLDQLHDANIREAPTTDVPGVPPGAQMRVTRITKVARETTDDE